MGFIDRLFGGRSPRAAPPRTAKLVLIHDRSDISPEMMESLRKDLISVISKYMEIDEKKIELDLEREDRSVALVASIPVVNVRRCGRSGGSRCP